MQEATRNVMRRPAPVGTAMRRTEGAVPLQERSPDEFQLGAGDEYNSNIRNEPPMSSVQDRINSVQSTVATKLQSTALEEIAILTRSLTFSEMIEYCYAIEHGRAGTPAELLAAAAEPAIGKRAAAFHVWATAYRSQAETIVVPASQETALAPT